MSCFCKNFLAIGALILSFAALQGPLWRSYNAQRVITLYAGTSVAITTDRNIEKAGILEKKTASPRLTNARQLSIRGNAPGRTTLIVCTKDGKSETYDVIVKAVPAKLSSGLITSR